LIFGTVGVRIHWIDGLDKLGSEFVAQNGFDFFIDLIADGHVVLRVFHHEFTNDADPHTFQWLVLHVFVGNKKRAVGLFRNQRPWNRGEDKTWMPIQGLTGGSDRP
jgi:hypothetical protein